MGKRILHAILVGMLLALGFLVLFYAYKLYWERTGFLFPNGQPFGGDYLAFYTGGVFYEHYPKSLYDFKAQMEYQSNFLAQRSAAGMVGFLPFVYPPLVAFLFSSLSKLNFETSYLLWSLFSFLLAVASVEMIRNAGDTKGIPRGIAYLFLVAFVPFSIINLSGGQLASIGLFCFAVIYSLILSGKNMSAGLMLVLAYYKPPLFLLFVLFASWQYRGFLKGAVLAVFLMGLLSILICGYEMNAIYLISVDNYMSGGVDLLNRQLPMKLNVGLIAPLVTGSVENISIFALMLFAALSMVKTLGKATQSVRLSLLVTASVLLSLQVNEYDLTILLLPTLVLYSNLFRRVSDSISSSGDSRDHLQG